MTTQTETQTVTAELAPLGVQLWPTRDDALYGDNFTLRSVAVVRDERQDYVVWTYRNGKTRTFDLGDQIPVKFQ